MRRTPFVRTIRWSEQETTALETKLWKGGGLGDRVVVVVAVWEAEGGAGPRKRGTEAHTPKSKHIAPSVGTTEVVFKVLP